MAQFPPIDRFVELQKRLAVLIDDEATWLAERPLLPERTRDRRLRGLIPTHQPTHHTTRRKHPMTTMETTNGVRNGVDTTTLFATLDAVKAAPAAAQFKFRASNRWISGTHSQSTIHGFFGVGEERAHEQATTLDVDHPKVLVGSDQGPTPVEYLLHGLAGCLTAGLANIAAARGVELTEVTSTVEGDIDLNGILGLNPDVRNGFSAIRVAFDVKGNAPAEKLAAIVEQSRARSAVFDVLTNGVPVSIEVNAG